MSPSAHSVFKRGPLIITSCLATVFAVAAGVWAFNGLLAGKIALPLSTACYTTALAATGWSFLRNGKLRFGYIHSLLWLGLTLLLWGTAVWGVWWDLADKGGMKGLAAMAAVFAVVLSIPFLACWLVTLGCVQCRREELKKVHTARTAEPPAVLPPAKIPARRK